MAALLAYDRSGQGKTIVLLHGFCENRTMWRLVVPELAKNYEVITIDLGGFGESCSLLPQKVSIDSLANQVLDLLHHLHVSSAIVFGHSLGGYVALAMAAQKSLSFRGLGLVHSSALADSEARQQDRNRVIKLVKKRGTPLFARNFIPSLFFLNRRPVLKKAIEEVQQMALSTPKNTIIQVTQAMRDRPNQTKALAGLSCPVLFLIGRQDTVIPLEQYQTQITIPQDAHIHILQDTAHMSTWECPEKATFILQNFVNYCTL